MVKITKALLTNMNMCDTGISAFTKVFPKGCFPTKNNIKKFVHKGEGHYLSTLLSEFSDGYYLSDDYEYCFTGQTPTTKVFKQLQKQIDQLKEKTLIEAAHKLLNSSKVQKQLKQLSKPKDNM